MSEANEQTFEQSLERIREIVTDLEGGELNLEDSILQFREGSTLIDHARKLITDAEMRVRVLTEEAEALEPESDDD